MNDTLPLSDHAHDDAEPRTAGVTDLAPRHDVPEISHQAAADDGSAAAATDASTAASALDDHGSDDHGSDDTAPDDHGSDDQPSDGRVSEVLVSEVRASEDGVTDDEVVDGWVADDAGSEDATADDPALEAAEPLAPTGFAALGLSEPILRAVAELGYITPTPVQEQAIPFVLMGRDVLGSAQTGTGKTAGFTLPMLDILSGSRARARMPRSLILEPTRELALQVAENFVKYGKYLKLTHALIIGGESMSDQKDLLMRGVDVLIATPGRLIDMFERGGMLLTDTRLLVIDEADRMLDMGFIPDVERIVSLLPKNRQTLFFSATMAPEIRRLAEAFLDNPKEITVSRPATVATTITTGLALVAEHDKREALRRLIRSEDVQNALIFCNRKRDVDILHKSLTRHEFSVGALHGDMAQPVRFATLEKFKAGELRLLCCSDVAARGLDIGGLSHVFNFDIPIHAEDYVHRIGRTGRAGRAGHAFSIASPDDRLAVEAIEKLTGMPIPRLVIPGLDPVAWAESDGRRRRRGGRTEKGRDDKRRDEKGRDEKGRGEKPRDDRKSGPARAPNDAPVAAAPARRERGPRPIAPAREAERTPDRARDHDREPPRAAPPPRDADRPRERRYRDDDLGPSVVGFGDDVPAFMMITARARPTPVIETAPHENTEIEA